MPSLPDKPTVLTPEVQRKIVDALANGSYLEPACRAAGVSKDIVDYWKRLYESGAEHAQRFAEFFSALARASAVAEQRALGSIWDGDPEWRAKVWFLERRFPRKWAPVRDRPKKQDASLADVLAEAMARAEELRRERDADGNDATVEG